MSTDLVQGVFPGLEGRNVAVTGGASGIGRGVVMMAARSGARVFAGDLNEAALAELEQDAKVEGFDIRPVRLDVTDPVSAESFVDEADADGDLYGVVCAAGIAPDTPVLDISLELWNKILAINLTGTFLVNQYAARAMVKHGQGGSIVNVTSGSNYYGAAKLGHYNASKAGVASLSKTMARELGADRIRVNCVAPGSVDTPLWRSRKTEEQIEKLLNTGKGPIQRTGQVDDMANCIGFLLSALSPWITGQQIPVNGGALMV